MKRIIIIIATSILLLIVCWLVGQAIHDNTDLATGEDSQRNVSSSGISDEEDFNGYFMKKWMAGDLLFDNSNETEDNPWGVTAGIIEVEKYGRCVLLTPNTAINIYGVSADSSLNSMDFQFRIHPWVSEISDGVGVNIWYLNENDEILMKEDFAVDNTDKWQKHTLKCEKEDIYNIKIMCNNGDKNDDNADWLLISFVE